jgi:hypothetical protein
MTLSRNQEQYHSSGRSNLVFQSSNNTPTTRNNNNNNHPATIIVLYYQRRHKSFGPRRPGLTSCLHWSPGTALSGRLPGPGQSTGGSTDPPPWLDPRSSRPGASSRLSWGENPKRGGSGRSVPRPNPTTHRTWRLCPGGQFRAVSRSRRSRTRRRRPSRRRTSRRPDP